MMTELSVEVWWVYLTSFRIPLFNLKSEHRSDFLSSDDKVGEEGCHADSDSVYVKKLDFFICTSLISRLSC